MLFHKERTRNTCTNIYIYLKIRYKKWKVNVFKSGNYLKKKPLENSKEKSLQMPKLFG